MPLASETATPESQIPNSPESFSHEQQPEFEYAKCVELLNALASPAWGDTKIRPALEKEDPENTNSCTRADLNILRMSIETTCNSVGPNTDVNMLCFLDLESLNTDALNPSQSPETSLYQSKELHPDFSKGPWTFVHFFTKNTLQEGFDLDAALSDSGINVNLVPNIVEYEDRGSYGLVVATSCLSLLSERFPHFKITNYNPFEPAEADVRIHGLYEAKRRSINKALKDIRNGWAHGTAECYRDAARKFDVEILLEKSMLNWDIHESNLKVQQCFTRNLLFFCLNILGHYDTTAAHNLLARDHNDWLRPFRDGHTDPSELLLTEDTSIRAREKSEWQIISLFRSFLEYSGGKVDCHQHSFDSNYTTTDNILLCARFLGVPNLRQFGNFDPEEIQAALSKSQLFTEASGLEIPDTLNWSYNMMASVPIGFPDNYMNLPPQVLYGFGVQQVHQLCVRFQHTYLQFPSLQKPQNNVLLLSAWGHTYQGQELEVVRDWVNSREGLRLYEKLINDLGLRQTLEDFTLTLLAFLGRERLLPYTMDDTAQPVRGSYLNDFDAVLNGQDISGRRTILERMVCSLMRVLHAADHRADLLQLLGEVLDMRPSLLTPLDGVSDQYCARKIRGDTHNTSFKRAIEAFLESAAAMVESNMDNDTDWTLIPRLPPALKPKMFAELLLDYRFDDRCEAAVLPISTDNKLHLFTNDLVGAYANDPTSRPKA